MAITFPERFNMATYFLDDRIEEGFGDKIAVYCGDKQYSYREVQQMANEVGNAARLAGGDVEVVVAPSWEEGNAASLAAAEPHLAGEPSFLLLCGDHAFSTGALVLLAEAGAPAVMFTAPVGVTNTVSSSRM